MKTILVSGLLSVLCMTTVAQGAEKHPTTGLSAETSRFSWDNDFYFLRDAQISNVFSYQHHDVAIMDEKQDDLWHRYSWAIQQTMQTPQGSTAPHQMAQDTPFVGSLTWQQSWYTFDAHHLDGLAITMGMVGPPSLADKTQEVVHQIRGVAVFEGWSAQHPTEPILNVHMMKKRKINITDAPTWWDMSVGGNASLGNLVTHVAAELEFRVGQNLPFGFAYVPNTFGFNNHYMANISAHATAESTLYVSLVLQLQWMAYNVYLDGSMFQHAPRIQKLPLLGVGTLGLHYETADFGLHLSILQSSQNVDTSEAIYAIGYEKLGALTYDWRY